MYPGLSLALWLNTLRIGAKRCKQQEKPHSRVTVRAGRRERAEPRWNKMFGSISNEGESLPCRPMCAWRLTGPGREDETVPVGATPGLQLYGGFSPKLETPTPVA